MCESTISSSVDMLVDVLGPAVAATCPFIWPPTVFDAFKSPLVKNVITGVFCTPPTDPCQATGTECDKVVQCLDECVMDAKCASFLAPLDRMFGFIVRPVIQPFWGPMKDAMQETFDAVICKPGILPTTTTTTQPTTLGKEDAEDSIPILMGILMVLALCCLCFLLVQKLKPKKTLNVETALEDEGARFRQRRISNRRSRRSTRKWE